MKIIPRGNVGRGSKLNGEGHTWEAERVVVGGVIMGVHHARRVSMSREKRS